jgi:hypothetical protein
MPGTVTVKVDLTGVPSGTVQSTTTLVANTTGDYNASDESLSPGENNFAVPLWAVGVVIRPAVSNVQSFILGPSDSAVILSPNLPSGPLSLSQPSELQLYNPGSSPISVVLEWF